MSPYLMRKRTSSQANPPESQLTSKLSSKQVKSVTRSVANKASKIKDKIEVTSTEVTRLRNAAAKKKVDTSMGSSKGVSQEEEPKVTRRRVLRRSIDKKVSTLSKKVATRNNAETKKQEVEDTKRKRIRKINNNSPSLRQLSLTESFSNQTRLRRLRSHKIVKNYKEDSTLIDENISPAQRNSTVAMKKLSGQKGKKLPVYRCVSPENPAENPTDVYDFECDSRERLPKKRKKRVIKKTIVRKKKKIVPEKQNVQKPEVREEEAMNVESKGIVEESPFEPLQNEVSVGPVVEKKLEKEPAENLEKEVKRKEEEPVAQSDVLGDRSKEQINAVRSKPVVISVQDLSSKRLTIMDNLPKSNLEDFRPFRPTNIFGNKFMVPPKSPLNHSLFEKSLSPITKPLENFNLDSPWRAPQLHTFSQVKSAFQSTPQNKRYDVSGRKLVRTPLNESKIYGNIAKLRDTTQKNNENVSAEGYANANSSKKKNLSSSRKFGTVITNIEHSLQPNVAEETSERVVIEAENVPPNFQLTSEINSSMINASKLDDTENKENPTLSTPSPKKVYKRGLKNVKALSPRKITSTRIDEQKENFDPQPGPSGLQSNRIFNEQRVLRQSNLNNFLNIMEMPQSTTIKTSHGLFDDGQSASVSSKPVIKIHEPDEELKHAFGFDDDSNQDVSPIEHEITNDEQKAVERNVETRDSKPFARISVAQIKNNLLPRRPLETVRDERNIKSKKVETKRSPVKSKEKVQFDISHFYDTFDVMSEISETPSISATAGPLFADCEPTHFTQPPRQLYKRKRDVSFNYHEKSDEEDEEAVEHETKRKKADKMKVEQKKRLMEWVQDINKTFEEVDQHELMVE